MDSCTIGFEFIISPRPFKITNVEDSKPSVINLKHIDIAVQDLLFDPQTSGGLMFALKEEPAMRLLKELIDSGLTASIVGGFQIGEPCGIMVRA